LYIAKIHDIYIYNMYVFIKYICLAIGMKIYSFSYSFLSKSGDWCHLAGL